jgi:hypothetical protein
LQRDADQRLPEWLLATLAALLLVLVGTLYYRKADVAKQEAAYWRQTPLALPGSSRIRIGAAGVAQLRQLTENVVARCDGFVGMPGFASLYFWTRIPPPAAINGAWILNLEQPYQRTIIEKMQTYKRPCVVYNPTRVKAWLHGRPLNEEQPLVRYIRQNFKSGPRSGAYTLLFAG